MNIRIQHRLHDSVNLVVAQLLERRIFLQLDNALAHKLPDAKRATPVSLPWMEAYLRKHFRFPEIERGAVVEMPAKLAHFVLARWNQFPEVRYVEPSHSKRRRGKARSGLIDA
jgi:hypothetical protein